MAVAPDDRPETETGTVLFVVELFPSSPAASSPQHSTPPALVTAQTWRASQLPAMLVATMGIQLVPLQKSPALQAVQDGPQEAFPFATHEAPQAL